MWKLVLEACGIREASSPKKVLFYVWKCTFSNTISILYKYFGMVLWSSEVENMWIIPISGRHMEKHEDHMEEGGRYDIFHIT